MSAPTITRPADQVARRTADTHSMTAAVSASIKALDVAVEAHRLLSTITDSGRAGVVVDRLAGILAALRTAAAEIEPAQCAGTFSDGDCCLADATPGEADGLCANCREVALPEGLLSDEWYER